MALTAEQKAQIIQQRLASFEQELFQHELNKATAEALNLPTTDSDAAIAQLTTAITVHETELAAITPAAVVDESPA